MITNLFECLLWGVLCALALTALCVFIANSLSGRKTNIIIAIAVALVLGYECVLGVGALYARSYVSDIHETVNLVIGESGIAGATDVADALSQEFPAIPSSIMDNVKAVAAGAASAGNVADRVATSVKSSIMSYFWKRAAWALGIMVLGTALLVYFAPKNKARTYRRSYGDDCGGSYGSSYDTDYSTTTTMRSRYSDYE